MKTKINSTARSRAVLLICGLNAATKGGSLITKYVLQSEGDLIALQAIEALTSTVSSLVSGAAADALPRRVLVPTANVLLFFIAISLAFGGDTTGFYTAYTLASPFSAVPLTSWFRKVKGTKRWPTRAKEFAEYGTALLAPFLAQALWLGFGRRAIVLDAISFLTVAAIAATVHERHLPTVRARFGLTTVWKNIVDDRKLCILWLIANVLFAYGDIFTAETSKAAGFLATYWSVETLGRIIAVITIVAIPGKSGSRLLINQSLRYAIVMAMLLPLPFFAAVTPLRVIHALLQGYCAATVSFGLYECIVGESPAKFSGMTAALYKTGYWMVCLLVKSPLVLVPVAAHQNLSIGIGFTAVVSLVVISRKTRSCL